MNDVAVEQAVKVYVRIREARAKLSEEFNKKDEELKRQLETLEAFFAAKADELGVDGFKTQHGTVFKEEKFTAACSDWDAFGEWVIQNNELEMLERRIKHATVKQYMADNSGALPPGVSVFREVKMRVRRA